MDIHKAYEGDKTINYPQDTPDKKYEGQKPLELAIELKKHYAFNTLLVAHRNLGQNEYGFDELDPALKSVISLEDKTARDFYFIEILRLLGASRDRENKNPLINSVLNGKFEVVKELLDSGSSPDIKNSVDETPLHLAILGGHNEVAHALINHQDTNVNSVDDQGYTPLHLAIKAGKNELARALINHKDIDVNLVLKGELPKDGSTNAAWALDDSPLILAIQHGNAELVGALIRHEKILPDLQDQLRNTALHNAIKNCVKTKDHNEVLGLKPARISEIFNTREFLEFINHEKTDINKADRNGDTPIHLVIKELITNQEEVGEYKTEMKSALDELALKIINHPKFNSQIIQNNDGITPLQLAQTLDKEDNHSLIELIEKKEAEKKFAEFTELFVVIVKPEQLNAEELSRRTKELNEQIQKLVSDDFDFGEIPDEYKCNIGLTLMNDPVKISYDEYVHHIFYDRKAITDWINESTENGGIATHPTKRTPIDESQVESLPNVKKQIDDLKTLKLIDALIESYRLGNPSEIIFLKTKIFIKDDSELKQKVMERAKEIKNTREEQSTPTTTPGAAKLGAQPQTQHER